MAFANLGQTTLHVQSQLPACRDTLKPPATSDHSLIEAKPLPAPVEPHKTRRRGRVAALPKLHRDMVNRMIWNGVPYKNIVAALDNIGFNLTERNISNWATAGFLEWRLEQDLVLHNRLEQDHLLDHLRRDDASELPEVGLQAAATRLSQILLLKTARADDIEANLGSFSEMVGVLCRLNREISFLQKQRDDSRCTLGRPYDPSSIKEQDQTSAIENERFYSDPDPSPNCPNRRFLPSCHQSPPQPSSPSATAKIPSSGRS